MPHRERHAQHATRHPSKGPAGDPSVLSRDRIGGVFGLERRHAAGQRQSVQLMPEHHKSLW
jgi:hypothetical protein